MSNLPKNPKPHFDTSLPSKRSDAYSEKSISELKSIIRENREVERSLDDYRK